MKHRFTRLLLRLLLLGLPLSLAQAAAAQTSAPPAPVAPPAESQSLEFIPNRGQWDVRARYVAEVPGGRLFLEDNALTYCFIKGLAKHHQDAAAWKPQPLRGHALRVSFVGAAPQPKLVEMMPTGAERNYFRGANPQHWARRVPGFRQLRYQEMWPGIDVRLYENTTQQLEYDFELAPKADPARVTLAYAGADALTVDEAGRLRIRTSLGTLLELAPKAWQTTASGQRQPVACAYELKGHTVSFQLGRYDSSRPLTIDPTVVFSSFTGATADNWGFTATYDQQGNLYSGGIVFDIGFPASPGAFRPNFNGVAGVDCDIALIKYNVVANGPAARAWATYLGGSSTEFPHSIVTNSRGELVLLGTTSSANYPTSTGAFQRLFRGGPSISPYSYPGGIYGAPFDLPNGSDLVVSRLSARGDSLLASTFVGGTGNDGLLENTSPAPRLCHNYGDYFRGDILLDATGNVYVASTTSSANFPTTAGSFSATYHGGLTDAVVLSLPPGLGSLRWSGLLGGSAADAAYSVQLDRTGQVFVAGGTLSANFPTTTGAYQRTWGGDVDAFAARISANGQTLQKATYLGTATYDQAYFLQLDTSGEVYLLGQTLSPQPISAGHYGVAGSTQFVQKLNAGLDTLRFRTVVGSGRPTIDFSPTAFLVDQCDRVYISGWGGGENQFFGFTNGHVGGLPVSPNAVQTATDSSDFYLAQYGPGMSTLQYATYYGAVGPGNFDHVDGGTSRFDPRGFVYQAVCACGTGGDNFPIPPGANSYSTIKGFPNCNNAAFKINFETIPIVTGTDSVVCATGTPLPLRGTPAGGIWTGLGVSGSLATGFFFTPSLALTGVQILTYSITGASICGTSAPLRLRVVVPAPASIAPLAANNVVCSAAAPVTLVGSPGGGTFGGPGVVGNTFNPVLAGVGARTITYTTVTRTGSLSCPVTATSTVQVVAPQAVVVPADTLICVGSTTAIPLRGRPAGGVWSGPGVSGSLFTSYFFTPPVNFTSATLTYTPPAGGCNAPASFRVGTLPVPGFLATWEPVNCPDGRATPLRLRFSSASTLNNSTASRVSWDFGDGTQATGSTVEHTYAQAGTFRPVATLYYGPTQVCSTATTLPSVEAKAQFIPDVITPNGDGRNDTFKPIFACNPRLRLYSRWGRLVYESTAYQNDWGAADQPAGIYYYLLEDGTSQRVRGWVEVIK